MSVKRTRKSSKHNHTAWLNEKSATLPTIMKHVIVTHPWRRLPPSPRRSPKKQGRGTKDSQQTIVKTKYRLDGEGREGSREKGKLTGRTVSRWVGDGLTEPPKKGRAQKNDRDFLRLVALHANMCQVGMTGEVDPKYLFDSKPNMIEWIMNRGSRPWTFWFDTQAEEEVEGTVETPPAEAEDNPDGEAGST
eukprot:scaffold4900_cov86-Skeletonema_menzelii.AAC.2